MDIYIKPEKKFSVKEKRKIFIGDLADVVAPSEAAKKIRNLSVLKISSDQRGSYLVRVTDLVRLIQKNYPAATVSNLGEMDTIVEYEPKNKQSSPVFTWIKIAFVVLVLLTGSATAIMSFHTDAQIPQVFQNYYKIFFGESKEKPLLMDIPYSIGLAAGIILFFNHIFGKKITSDPTPIEVEMTVYENDVTDTVVEKLKP
ncbi:MAG: stage V sporulation protein AA [Clostridiales bacterium]|jgi:stage V sporulation protein AA|nr:stage V sporulation protein AA [Clostridiales bacterium]